MASAEKPNVLFFLADQMRFDCAGYAGKYPVSTPNIDRVGREGTTFTRAFTPTPVCAPARQSFLSGRRPETLGAQWNYSFIETKTLMPSDRNFLSSFARAGYQNAFIGHWDASVRPPEEFGAAEYRSLAEYREYVKEKYPGAKYHNGWFGELSPIPLEDSRTHWCAGRACEAIEKFGKTGKPWFVWVDGTDPHLPCRPSEPFYSRYPDGCAVKWDGFGDAFEDKPYIQKQQLYNWGLEGRSWEQWAPSVARYYAMISQTDDAFGRILGLLDEKGLSDDTVVIFTSDHGDMCGSHGMIDKHYVLYDDVIRVPLVIRFPARFGGGVRCDDFVSSCLDLAPTLAQLCGLDMFRGYSGHGRSLAPLLEGEKDPGRQDCAVCASSGQQFGLFTQRCVRTAEYKYVWNLTDVDEFYDLGADPGEKRNLIREYQGSPLLAELRGRMKEELVRCGDPFVRSGWLERQLTEGKKLL